MRRPKGRTLTMQANPKDRPMFVSAMKTIGLAAVLLTAACDDNAKKGAAAGEADASAKAKADEAKDAKDAEPPAQDEAAKARAAAAAEVEAKEKAHQAATALLPKLYERATEQEAVDEIGKLGSHAVGTLAAQLKEQLTAFATAMESFGAGRKGSKEDAMKASDHQSKVDSLIKALKATGEDGVVAAKKALDALPPAQQKLIADMLRSRHDLFK